MKLTLVVMTPGKSEGKVIPITRFPFFIGREAQCHLRPASALVSKRHCALLVENGRAFVRDFKSTNGTFVDDVRVEGEGEVREGTRLTIGPLHFMVRLDTTPTSAQAAGLPGGLGDEEAATILLNLPEPELVAPASLDSEGVPMGSTEMEILPPDMTATDDITKTQMNAGTKKQEKTDTANTSDLAKAVLEKYRRQKRTI